MATNCIDPSYPDAKSSTSFQDGLEFQDFVCEQLAKEHIILQNLSSKKWQYNVGENLQGFEIKLDNRCTDTKQLSIEVAEKRAANVTRWTPSGILRTDNTWLYIQGNRQVLYIFGKNVLILFYRKYRPTLSTKYGTIQTFYLPFWKADDLAAHVIHIGHGPTGQRPSRIWG